MIPPPATAVQMKEGKGYHPLYLTWTEESLGAIIQQAHYEHRIQDEKNAEIGEVDRFNASFDDRNRVWFIPLSRFFKRSEQDADPAEVHFITLDLLKAGGERVLIKVRLRMAAPVPLIQAKVLPMGVPGPRFLFTRTIVKEGWPMLTEEYTNPTARRLALWIRLGNQPGPTVAPHLNQFLFFAGCGTEWHSVATQYLVQFPLLVGRLRVKIGVEGSWETDSVKDGKWRRFNLGPTETISLSWMADLPAGYPVFARNIPPGGWANCPAPDMMNLHILHSVQLAGELNRELVLTDGLVHNPDYLTSGSSRSVLLAPGPVRIQVENGPPHVGTVRTLPESGIVEAILYSGREF